MCADQQTGTIPDTGTTGCSTDTTLYCIGFQSWQAISPYAGNWHEQLLLNWYFTGLAGSSHAVWFFSGAYTLLHYSAGGTGIPATVPRPRASSLSPPLIDRRRHLSLFSLRDGDVVQRLFRTKTMPFAPRAHDGYMQLRGYGRGALADYLTVRLLT